MPRASRRCPGDNGNCANLIRDRAHCPEHTVAWHGRTASSRVTMTHAWRKLRPEILRRDDYQCQIRIANVCTGYASEVDKIAPATQRPDLALDPANCRAACPPCNAWKARHRDGKSTVDPR